MRIISKFHDYYDSGMSEGQDRSLVFMREHAQWTRSQAENAPASLRLFAQLAQSRMPRPLNLNRPDRKHMRVLVSFGVVLLAGRLYPLAEVERITYGVSAERDHHWVYELDELVALLDEHDYDILAGRSARRTYQELTGKSQDVKSFYALRGNEALMAHALEHRLPLLSVQQSIAHLEQCPQLQALQFYRCMNPWQVYQELSMFLGNLAAPERNTVVIADKDRIAQHGFDKWSFRRPPSQ